MVVTLISAVGVPLALVTIALAIDAVVSPELSQSLGGPLWGTCYCAIGLSWFFAAAWIYTVLFAYAEARWPWAKAVRMVIELFFLAVYSFSR